MPSRRAKNRSIQVNYLTRAEGEAALRIHMRDGELIELRLEIFEPPRFFESFLRGRDSREAPDLTARICGICPVAYQMSTVHAFERLYDITIDPAVRELRRLYLCGEWIESHALHIHMLAAPDFLGCDSIITLADRNREAVERGLRIKKAGNAIIAVLGGRSVHPVGACIGGFTRAPRRAQLADLREQLLHVRDDAVECVRWVSHFDLPAATRDIEFVSLRHPDEYPMNEGRIASSKGIDAAPDDFDDFFEEHQVPYSNALHCKVKGRGPYFLGPLARVNLNFDRMGQDVTSLARDTGHSLAQFESLHEHRRTRPGSLVRDRRGGQSDRRVSATARACRIVPSSFRSRTRDYRGAARFAVSRIRNRRAWPDSLRAYRAADIAEPGSNRSRSARAGSRHHSAQPGRGDAHVRNGDS